MADIRLLMCIQFAAHRHRNQRRKDPPQTPYINHPINVAAILAVEANITDSDTLLAAILHDTVEDTDTSLEEIETLFGKDIAKIVCEVTDDKDLPKNERKRLQIQNAPCLSEKARLVRLADKLDNLRDLQCSLPIGWTEEERTQYFRWSKCVVDKIRGSSRVLENQLDAIFKVQCVD